MKPNLSVIICTRNRSHYLGQTLSFYEQLTTALSWELVIVDNGSNDATMTILNEFKNRTAFSVQVISEPIVGLSHARNTGWQCAKGEIIIFTDDDCYPQPNFLDEIWDIFLDSQIDYLGGRVLLYDPADYPITIQKRNNRVIIAPRSFIPAGLIHGANMVVRKAVFQKIGGFDEMLGAGTRYPCEDTDFISRASTFGLFGVYDPRPVVFHHHRRRTKEQVNNLMFSYDLGRGAYFMKCLLDQFRRREAAKNWYWLICTRLRSCMHQPREVMAICYELQGALGYLYTRISNKFFYRT